MKSFLNNKIGLPLILGVLLSSFMLILWFILFNNCIDDLGCLAFLVIPILPGFLLKLEGATSIIVSIIFWFLIGSLIGFLVYKIKKR